MSPKYQTVSTGKPCLLRLEMNKLYQAKIPVP